ncbi:MAG: hypothetical protein K6E94_00695 [Elusimicrobiaceae bacterium]|jgi:hypothetical protein|nr:hypothetical protein [Elusimicrobiaceae bacterium]
MKIENLEKVQDLAAKRSELRKISGLLASTHSMIVVYESTSTSSEHESTWDGETKAALTMIVEQRISEIEKELETL